MAGAGITLVLSGGGVKSAAAIGVAKVLAAAGLAPTRYVGTSMGAVMAALLATGMTPQEAEQRVLAQGERSLGKTSLATLARGIFAPSLVNGDRLEALITALLPVARFDQLRFPLTVTATDLDSRSLALFGAGGIDLPLVIALSASCALPVYLPPRVYQGHRYADGGLRAVLPLEVAAQFPAERVIAVDTGSGFDELPATSPPPPALIGAHDASIGILMAEQTRQALAAWRGTPGRPPLTYLRPPVAQGATFQAAELKHYIDAGERTARAALTPPTG